ncbi:MAG: hypothetical protein ACOCVX_01650 [Bacteroidales bacterium]
MDKEKFRIQAKQKIDDLVDRINKFERKQYETSEKTKVSYEKQISELEVKLSDLKKNYDELKTKNEQKWQLAKQNFNKGAEYISTGLKKLTEG